MAALVVLAALVLQPIAPALAAINTGSTALQIAQAIAVNPSIVTGASFVTRPPTTVGTSTASADSAVGSFPTNGGTFGILSTGKAIDVDTGSPVPDTQLGGGNIRGNSDFDVTILKVDLNVPSGVNCLSFDFQFFTREFPEYVGQEFNDAFIAELNTSNWTTSGSTISAPNNFAFDPGGNPISVNSAGFAALTNGNAAGTRFGTEDGATPLLQARTPITPGANSVYFSIFDQQDAKLDSAVFLDNLSVSNVASGECATGASLPKPTLTKAFSPSTVVAGNTTTLTFTIANTPGNPAQSGINFTDTLPTGATFTAIGANTCGGTPSIGGGGSTFTLTGGALSASTSSCTVAVTVLGSTAGTYVNDSTRISDTANLNAGNVNATLNVAGNATLSKAYSPATITQGNTTTLTFTISNSTGNPAQTGLGFKDTLDAGIVFTGTPTTTCPGGSVSYVDANQAVQFGGNLNVGQASCTITTTVQGTTYGTYLNDSDDISAVTGGLQTGSTTATLTVNPLKVILTKAFSPSTVNAWVENSVLTFTLTNPAGMPAQSGLGFRDTLPGSGNTVRFVTGTASTTCGGTPTLTIGGTNNTQFTVGGTGVTVPAGPSTCTVSVTVTTRNNGSVTNATAQISNLLGNIDASTLTATLTINEPRVKLTKAFAKTPIITGETTTATFTLTNIAGNPAQTGIDFTDTLPGSGGLIFTTVQSNTCNGTPTIGGSPSGTAFTLTGGSMAAGASTCTIVVGVQGVVAGTYNNTSSRISGESTNLAKEYMSASIVVNTAPPSLTKAFGTSPLQPGETTTLTFTLTNGGGNPVQTGLGFTDTLSGGGALIFVSSPAPASTCSPAGTLNIVNSTTFTVSGAGMSAGMPTCTITVTVQAVEGNRTGLVITNDSTNITGVTGNINTTGVNTTITINDPRPTLTKNFSPTAIDVGSTSSVTFTISNGFGLPAQSGLSFTDTLPGTAGNILFTGPINNTCGGTATLGGSPTGQTLTLTGGALAAAQDNCTITLTVQGNATGIYVNDAARISGLGGGLKKTGLEATLTVNATTATLTKAFGASAITAGNTTTLTFTLTNGFGNTAKTGLAFTDTLPGGGNIVFEGTPTNTCGGTVTLGSANTALSLAGGALGAGETACTITATVRGVRSGTFVNDTSRISGLSSNLINNVNATLTVNVANATLTKAFTPNTVNVGIQTTLIFTITNGAGNEAKSNLGFTDTLPSGITYSGVTSNTCGGTVTLGSGNTTLTLANGALADGAASCQISATIDTPSRGVYVNNAARVSGITGGLINNVNATLTVNEPRPTLTKAFAPNNIAVGQTSILTFTLTNGDGNEAQTGLAFTDTLPGAGGAIFTGTPTTTCPAGILTIGGGGTTLTLTGGAMSAAQTSCTITVSVQGVTAGTYVNNSGQISGLSSNLINNVDATLTVRPAPSLTKAFSLSTIALADTANLVFTITNGAGNPAQSGISFTDTLTGGNIIFGGTPSTTCPAGTPAIVNASTFQFTGGALNAGQASCTVTVRVEGAFVGTEVNTAANISNVGGGLITTGVSASITVNDPRAILTKAFSPKTIVVGNTSVLTFTITNGTGNGAKSNLGFRDTLPGSGGVIYTGTPVNTCGGSVVIGGGGTQLTLTNGALSAGQATCTITVDVQGVTVGTYLNDNRQITNVTGSLVTKFVNDTLVVTNVASLTKEFVRSTIGVGGVSTLTFTITKNVPAAQVVSGLNFTDTLPTNVTVVGMPTTPQCGATVSSTTGSITVTGASLAAGVTTCQITVPVTSSVIGVYPNTDSNNISAVAGGLDTTGVNATLTVVAATQLSKAYTPTSIPAGDTSVLTFTITNAAGNPAQSGIGFTDTLHPNVTVSGAVTSPQCGGTVTGSGNVISVTGASLSAGQASCTIAVVVTSLVAGVYPNTSTNISDLDGGLLAGSVDATLTVTSTTTLSKRFIRPLISVGGVSQLRFTITNGSGLPARTGLGFTDTLPANVTVWRPPTVDQCGGTVSVVGQAITVVGAELAAGQASCIIIVNVTSVVPGTYTNDINNISNLEGGLSATGITATLEVINQPMLSKTFSPATISAGGTSTLTFTITNSTGNPAVSGLGFVDTLPTAVTANGTPTNTCGATVTAVSNVITVSNASLTLGQATCTISVPVTATAAGTYVNNAFNISDLQGGLIGGDVNATLTVLGPRYNGPKTVLLTGFANRPVSQTLTITNTGAAGTTLNVALINNSNPAVFTVTGFPLSTVQGSAGATFTVRCIPRAGGDLFGILTLQTNEAGNPLRGVNLICRPAAQTIGVFRPSNATFYLRFTNTSLYANLIAQFGQGTDQHLAGDWNNDGFESIGIWRPSTAQFQLKDVNSTASPVVYTFAFGLPGDIALAGDWNGDGIDTIGVYRPSNKTFYLRNSLSSGPPNHIIVASAAEPGDIPVAGDWDGDGRDSIGYWRPSNFTFYVYNTLCTNCTVTTPNLSGQFGITGDVPVVGDWNADGITGFGVWRSSNQFYYLRNNLLGIFAQVSFRYGLPGDRPVIGYWALPPAAPPPAAPPNSQDEAPSFVPKQ
jgi:uncharacterized repeat protein (TIGR01451 family)